jgi:hypothetical protein
VIETYRLGFLHLDPEQLASIWDRQHEPLVYVAQEKEEPIRGWAAIERYLAALPEHLDEVLAKDLDNVQIDVSSCAFSGDRCRGRVAAGHALRPVGVLDAGRAVCPRRQTRCYGNLPYSALITCWYRAAGPATFA